MALKRSVLVCIFAVLCFCAGQAFGQEFPIGAFWPMTGTQAHIG